MGILEKEDLEEKGVRWWWGVVPENVRLACGERLQSRTRACIQTRTRRARTHTVTDPLASARAGGMARAHAPPRVLSGARSGCTCARAGDTAVTAVRHGYSVRCVRTHSDRKLRGSGRVPGLDILVGFEPQTSCSGVGLTTVSRLQRIQQPLWSVISPLSGIIAELLAL